jgi:hypothetical protein
MPFGQVVAGTLESKRTLKVTLEQGKQWGIVFATTGPEAELANLGFAILDSIEEKAKYFSPSSWKDLSYPL